MIKNVSNENYFNNIDCDLKAYLLGFFLADGCITMNSGCKNSYKLSINISEIDKNLVELYQQTICPNNKRKYFIEKLYNKMYNNSEFSLDRKRLKFESYLNTVLNK